MDRISNADQLAQVLRLRLAERLRENAKAAGAARSSAPLPQANRIAAAAPRDDQDERQLRRTFVQQILIDQLGSNLVNDAQMQQIVTRVAATIDDDPEPSRLLHRLVKRFAD